MHRNAGIDVLRGVAIVLVVLHHVGLRISLKDSEFFLALAQRLTNTCLSRINKCILIPNNGLCQ
jgi:peptidoglycan/LPS O-acetylase OafA/YrhL